MKKFALGMAVLLMSTQVFAYASRSIRPNIYKGALNVAGSVSFGADTNGNSFTRMDPMVAYFLYPDVAVGGIVNMWSVAGSNNYAVGPLVDYYFFLRDRMAASGGGGLLMYNTEPGGSYYAIQPNAKFLYFITPSVSFGPAFYYSIFLSQPTYIKNDYRFVGMFSIFF